MMALFTQFWPFVVSGITAAASVVFALFKSRQAKTAKANAKATVAEVQAATETANAKAYEAATTAAANRADAEQAAAAVPDDQLDDELKKLNALREK